MFTDGSVLDRSQVVFVHGHAVASAAVSHHSVLVLVWLALVAFGVGAAVATLVHERFAR